MQELKNLSTHPPVDATKEKCKERLAVYHKKLFELQNIFYADGRFGLLIILQGIDTSGKDSTIRHVMSCMNPMGLRVQSFRKPTEEEQKHDFLWRVYPHMPAKGMIGVFNRSYYEDIVIPTILNSLDQEKIDHRITLVRELEHHLVLNNIHVLKFFLHLSKEEQKIRIGERLSNPHKRWKYSEEDEMAALQWDAYSKIYDILLKNSNQVPWNIIPADKRWYRNFLVAKTLTDYLEKLNLKYPDT